MNKFVINAIVNTIVENIEKYAAKEVWYSKDESKYYMSRSNIFTGISVPDGMLDCIINEFNSSEFANSNCIEIVRNENNSLVAWFK